MENIIINQIRILQELRNKCLETTGYYGDIDTAIAALQICSTLGLDNTARFIGTLNRVGITDHEKLNQMINDSLLQIGKNIIIKDDKKLCPNCMIELENNGIYCSHCGQKLIFENSKEIKPIII